jgi:hypothetical protein
MEPVFHAWELDMPEKDGSQRAEDAREVQRSETTEPNTISQLSSEQGRVVEK